MRQTIDRTILIVMAIICSQFAHAGTIFNTIWFYGTQVNSISGIGRLTEMMSSQVKPSAQV